MIFWRISQDLEFFMIFLKKYDFLGQNFALYISDSWKVLKIDPGNIDAMGKYIVGVIPGTRNVMGIIT